MRFMDLLPAWFSAPSLNSSSAASQSNARTDSSPDRLLTILKSELTETLSVDEKRDLQQDKDTALAGLLKNRLRDAPLDLHQTDLRELCLTNLALSGANLEHAKLSQADLTYADLIGANLTNAKLAAAKLIGTNLTEANLTEAGLIEADLSFANLSFADLTNANLFSADLTEADLSNADLSNANLSNADLTNADLSDANLSNANLSNANLSGVHFSCLQLIHIKDLSGVDPQGLHLNTPTIWHDSEIDVYLNHINNPSGSVLTAIDSIDSKYDSVKTTLVSQLVASLQDEDTSSVSEALIKALNKEPYINDTGIATFLNTIAGQHLEKYDSTVMPTPTKSEFDLFVKFFSSGNEKSIHEKMLSHNGALTQLVAHGIDSTNDDANDAKALYATYLKHEKINLYTRDFNFGDFAGSPDWGNKLAANYILWPASNKDCAMMLTHDDLKKMLAPDDTTEWNRFFLFNGDGQPVGMDGSPEDLFEEDFKIFLDPYQSTAKYIMLDRLLSELELGDDYHTLFMSATRARTVGTNEKLISTEHQQNLSDIFNRKLSYDIESGRYALNDAHYDKLISNYDLSDSSDNQKAETLGCIASIFTLYSSSRLFGTENDSPEALRKYAYALMAKAHELAPSIIPEKQFTDWTNRLLGLDNAFSCTAVLSGMMVKHMTTHCPKEISYFMPVAWR
ncbi:pentapeptide repeat-containing protein [Pseudomonas alkylphenolica]|uniref:pentapeptide repeat-containing protein n=1 Tax=Pseudomonas alkylphenolica TaxID=237609 RepID=UPI00315DD06D